MAIDTLLEELTTHRVDKFPTWPCTQLTHLMNELAEKAATQMRLRPV